MYEYEKSVYFYVTVRFWVDIRTRGGILSWLFMVVMNSKGKA